MLCFSNAKVNAPLIAGNSEIVEASRSFGAFWAAVGANSHAD